MSNEKPSLLKDLRDQLGALGGQVREAAALRLQLALQELQADAQAVRRLVVVVAAAAVMALTSLPILAVLAADCLDGYGSLGRRGWLAIFAGGLLLLAVASALGAWLRFRRRFTALQQTREELAEDALWLQEWLNAKSPASDDAPPQA